MNVTCVDYNLTEDKFMFIVKEGEGVDPYSLTMTGKKVGALVAGVQPPRFGDEMTERDYCIGRLVEDHTDQPEQAVGKSFPEV